MNDSRKPPLRVAITGAAGQIGYQLSFRIASGQLFGPDQPVILQLIEIPPRHGCAAGRGHGTGRLRLRRTGRCRAYRPARSGFQGYAVRAAGGVRGRAPADMERKDLLMANAQIFSIQGRALNAVADRDVRVLVVGNPANTNALIARTHAPRP